MQKRLQECKNLSAYSRTSQNYWTHLLAWKHGLGNHADALMVCMDMQSIAWDVKVQVDTKCDRGRKRSPQQLDAHNTTVATPEKQTRQKQEGQTKTKNNSKTSGRSPSDWHEEVTQQHRVRVWYQEHKDQNMRTWWGEIKDARTKSIRCVQLTSRPLDLSGGWWNNKEDTTADDARAGHNREMQLQNCQSVMKRKWASQVAV